jgi:membrane protein required for beta-lactamase induction
MMDGILTLVVALIGASGAVLAAWTASKVKKDQDTGNGHSIGSGVARIEEVMHALEMRLDSIEIQLREHAFWLNRHQNLYRHERRWNEEEDIDV